MKAGKETELYNQGYMDGFDDAQRAHIEPIKPKIKDVKEKSFPKDEDYWTRLEHIYAGLAMQGIVSKQSVGDKLNTITDVCCDLAHALVEQLKERE